MTEVEFANDWEQIHKNVKWGQVVNAFLTEALEAMYLKREDASSLWFLDLGCGTGASTLPLLRYGCNVVAVDIAPTAIETLKSDALDIPNCGVLEAIVGDVTNLDSIPAVTNHKYDWIVDTSTLMCLSLREARAVSEGAQKYLKANGTFFSVMPCEPFVVKFDRGHYFRLVKDKHELKMLFAGYSSWIAKAVIFVGDPEDPDVNTSYVIRAING